MWRSTYVKSLEVFSSGLQVGFDDSRVGLDVVLLNHSTTLANKASDFQIALFELGCRHSAY